MTNNWRTSGALLISLGGGVVVGVALLWILYTVTTQGWAASSAGAVIGLPLIVILGVTILLITIGLVAFSFSTVGLSSPREALGLPDGSVRAIIALMLLVVFSIMSIFLFSSLSSLPPQTLSHVSQKGLDDLSTHVAVIRREPEPASQAAAGQPAPEPLYTVTFLQPSGAASDIAKQLIVMLGTLVTAVASFYFASASTVSAQRAVTGNGMPGTTVQAPTGPTPGLSADFVSSAAPFTTLLSDSSLVIPDTINKAFLGHGIFLEYSPIDTLRRYAGYGGNDPSGATLAQMIDRFIKAMQDMHVGSVWIQLFTSSGQLDGGHGGTSELVTALAQANIPCAGWGYCYSRNAANDGDLAKKLCHQYGIKAFIADVEPGNTVNGAADSWDPQAFKNLIASLKGTFGKDNLGISTFGSLALHPDAAAIYKLAVNDVSFFAPQIYWYAKAPVTYAKACIASFRSAGINNPLIATTQAYWQVDRHTNFPRTSAEGQVTQFVRGFADWANIIGLNWYHGGNANTASTGSMSDAMISTIAAARLDQKPFAAPAPAVTPATS
jgi:hypothetical protein